MENVRKILMDAFVVECDNPQCVNQPKFICEVCSAGYCSERCQVLDWHCHKYICKPMPPLLPLLENPISNSQFMNFQTEEDKNNENPPSNAQKELAATKSGDHKKNGGAALFQVNSKNHEEATISGGKPPSTVAQPVVAAPMSFGKNKEPAEMLGKPASIVAQPVVAAPKSFGKYKKGPQMLGKSSLLIRKPTIGAKYGGAVKTQGKSQFKAKIIASKKSGDHKKYGGAAQNQVNSKNHQVATISQGKPPSIVAQPVVAAPMSSGKDKEADEMLGIEKPTIGDKHGGAVETEGKPPLKAAIPFYSFLSKLFRKEEAQTDGKGSSINAMLTIDVKNEEGAQMQELSLSKVVQAVISFPSKLFQNKAAELQEEAPLATAVNEESTGYSKSIISDKADEASTTKKTAPVDVAVKSIEKPLTTIEEWKTFYEIDLLKFLTFRVQHVLRKDPLIIWIIDERFLPDLQELEDHIHTHVQANFNRVSKESIAEGMLLFALINLKQLYRVKVIQYLVQQKKFLVKAIDYGKTFVVDCNNLFEASAKAAGMKAFAFPVEIHGKRYDVLIQPKAKIHLRLFKAAGVGGFIKAEIQCESNKRIIDFLSLNDNEIEILKISGDRQSALVQCNYTFNVVTEDLTNTMESSALKVFNTSLETYLVAAHTENGWHRGALIDSLPGHDLHLIYLIDEGFIKLSDKLQCLPYKLALIPPCAFVIAGKGVQNYLKTFENNNQLAKLQILYEPDKKLILYCDSNRIGEIYLKSYCDDKEFYLKVANQEINASGSDVYITKLIKHGQVYINLADSQLYPRLFEQSTPKCSKYNELKRPTLQEMVLVKENGEDYYRGLIFYQSFDNEDIFDVWNVDTGNLHESVHMNRMLKVCKFIRYLPRHLQELNLSMLYTLPAEAFPTTSANRLNAYIQAKTLFQVEYTGKSFTEGNLILKGKGIDLSTELLPLVNQHFTLQDVTVKSIPAGQNIDVFMLDSSNLKCFGYICCTHFANQLEKDEFYNNVDKVHAYGQRTRNEIKEDFIVGINELCVAMFKDDGCWYRARCVSHDVEDMMTIKFLDYGNIQKMSKYDSLPITKDLLYPMYANVCYIDGYQFNKSHSEFDTLVRNETRLNCREIINAGAPGYFTVKLNM